MRLQFIAPAVALLLGLTQPVLAGLIRHDRDIKLYRDAAQKREFACVGRITLTTSGKHATGGVDRTKVCPDVRTRGSQRRFG